MSLLQMSFSGAVLILVIAAVRAAAIHRLSKTTFLVLWCLVLARLLIPFSIPSPVSVYSLVGQSAYGDALEGTPIEGLLPISPPAQTGPAERSPQIHPSPSAAEPVRSVSPWFVIWCVGSVSCAVFFSTAYFRWLRKFRASVPVDNRYITQWLREHPSGRPISVRQGDGIDTPLTYGLFRPVILMPPKTDWEDTDRLQYILFHEYLHIRRFDAVIKLIALTALCVHWFNPLVWGMVLLLNRNLELSCDENVLRRFGPGARADYARVLVRMEAQKSGLMPLYNSFSKNAIEERITSIMKMKKSSLLAVFVAVILVAGISSGFITSAEGPDGSSLHTRLFAYLNMPYGQFRKQVGTQAEFYHGLYFQAPVPGEDAYVVFLGSYDEEIAGTVLSNEDQAFRVESSLDHVISGIDGEMTPGEFKEALDRYVGFGVSPDILEGLTAYYVAYHYIEAGVDSNGDGVLDIQLDIALDEADHIAPNARVWITEAVYEEEDTPPSVTPTKTGWVWPTIGREITLPYSETVGHLAGEDGVFSSDHITIRGEAGDDVYAALDGQVDEVAFDVERGQYIVISGGEGTRVMYGHLDETSVTVGSKVSAGEKIGTVGKTGWATSNCLLFAVFTADGAVDPMIYFP